MKRSTTQDDSPAKKKRGKLSSNAPETSEASTAARPVGGFGLKASEDMDTAAPGASKKLKLIKETITIEREYHFE